MTVQPSHTISVREYQRVPIMSERIGDNRPDFAGVVGHGEANVSASWSGVLERVTPRRSGAWWPAATRTRRCCCRSTGTGSAVNPLWTSLMRTGLLPSAAGEPGSPHHPTVRTTQSHDEQKQPPRHRHPTADTPASPTANTLPSTCGSRSGRWVFTVSATGSSRPPRPAPAGSDPRWPRRRVGQVARPRRRRPGAGHGRARGAGSGRAPHSHPCLSVLPDIWVPPPAGVGRKT